MTVIPQDEGIDPAKGRRARAKHDAKAEQPVQRRADAKIHQVFHQDVAGVFGPGKACLAHGKARLHEETRAAPSNTQMVFAGEYVMFLTSVSVEFSTKKAPGASSTPLRLVGMMAFYAGESRLSRGKQSKYNLYL